MSNTNRSVQSEKKSRSFEFLAFGFKNKGDNTFGEAKVKVLSSLVTAQLMCVFVFTYVKPLVSQDVVQIMSGILPTSTFNSFKPGVPFIGHRQTE